MARLLLAGCLAAAIPTVAWAQANAPTGPAEEAKGPSYVLPYFLTVLGLGLGLLVVGRPSRRRDTSPQSSGPA